MAILVGSSNANGWVAPKKKKREEEAAPAPAPQPVADAASKVAKAYYGRTGRFPSPEKHFALTSAVQRDPTIVTQQDVDSIFPDWVKAIVSPDDPTLEELVGAPAKEAHRQREEKRKHPKWTKAELASLPIAGLSADATRALANSTIHGDEMSASEIADIEAAREWYVPGYGEPGGGTELKARIIARQAGALANGTPDEAAPPAGGPTLVNADGGYNIREIRKYAKESGQLSDTLMDPYAYAKLRDRLEGKDREELNEKQLGDLDALAARFSKVYPGFAKHYGGDKSNVRWDAYFDQRFTNYVLFGNLAYAMGLAQNDPDGKLKEQAQRNIAVATRNAIPVEDDIYTALSFVSSTGDPNNPDSASAELGNALYAGYRNVHSEFWGDRRVAASYAHDFGEDALPDAVLVQYRQDRSAWDPALQKLTRTIEGGANVTDFSSFIDTLADGINDPDQYVMPLEGQPEPERDPAVVVRRGGGTVNVSNDPTYHFMSTVVAPFIEDYLGRPAMAGLSWAEKQKNRVFLATAIQSAKEYEDKLDGKRVAKPIGGPANYVRLPDEYKESNSWSVASRLTSADPAGGQEFMQEMWRQNGWNPEEHGALFFAADLAWSIAVDVVTLDPAVGLLAGAGKVGAASLARKMLSPKLQAKVAEAEAAVNAAMVPVAAARKSARVGAKEAASAASTLRGAKATLSLLERPRWYDTHAIGFSKGTQKGHQVQRYFGLSEDGLSIDTLHAMRDLTGRIGKSRDADEVLELMNDLRHTYGFKLDPGATFYGRALRYHRMANMGDHLDAGYARETLESGLRIHNGLGDINEEIVKHGTLSRMGHANTAAGRQQAAREIDEMLDELRHIDGKTIEEINLKKRKVWAEAWKRIEGNMKARKVTAAERKVIVMWAKRSRTPLEKGWDDNAWAALKTADAVAAPRMKRGRALSGSRAWGDERAALEAAKKMGLDDEAAAKQAAEFVSKPVNEFQLAKDLIVPIQPQKLIAFQKGHRALSWELRQTTGIVGVPGVPFLRTPWQNWMRIGPSPDAVTTAFKQLVIGRVWFALQVMGIDEFWRPGFQESLWKRVLKPGEYSDLKNTEGIEAQFKRVASDNITEAARSSDTWVVRLPSSLDDDSATLEGTVREYVRDFNGHTEAISQETYMRVLRDLPRREGESVDDWGDRFEDALTALATGQRHEAFAHLSDEAFEEASATFRIKMQEMGLDWRGTPDGSYMPAADIAASNEARTVQLEQAWDDINEIHKAQDALVTENAQLRASMLGREADSLSFNAPSKQYTDAWAKQRGLDELDDASRKQLASDWQDAVMRQRGKETEWGRYKAIREEKAANSKRLKEARAVQHELDNAGALRLEPGSAMEMQFKYWAETARKGVMLDDELLDATLHGKKLSLKRVKAMRGRLQEKGSDLPTFVGIRNAADWGPGSIPGVTQLNNLTTMKVMDKFSTMMSRAVFLDHWALEHDRLLALGLKADEAFERAGAVAQREVERVLYKHSASPIENAGRNIALFLPAYRQATVYWAKVAARHPFLMTNIRERGKDWDIPLVRIGDYQYAVPKPFWMANDFADIGIPGFGPMIITPLRAMNSWTGYTENSEGEDIYTGNTKLDALKDIAPLSFINKASSPLAWADDALYGIIGENMYAPAQGTGSLSRIGGALWRSLFRDEKKRVQLSQNIANMQVSAGIRPDYEAALKEMRDKPWWQDILDALIAGSGGQAEGILAAASRQGFINRVAYKPADLGGTNAPLSLPERVFGNEAISMANARYEYSQASGDHKKMEAVLEKYPTFRPIVEFYDMNARQKAEWLLKPANLRLLPYVSSANNYDIDGRLLTGFEYWREMKEGHIYRKSMNEYWADMQSDFVDIGWYKTLKGIKTKRDTALKSAHKLWTTYIDKHAVNAGRKAEMLNDLKFYEQGWMADLPPKDAYSIKHKPTAPDWMELAARELRIYNDPFKWSAYALNLRYNQAIQSVDGGGVTPAMLGQYGFPGPAAKIQMKGQRPEGALPGGIEDKWMNAAAYGGSKWAQRMGEALRVVDELKKYALPEYKPSFDMRRSVSWATINETMTEGESYRRYQQTKMAGGEYWKLTNVADTMAALGVSLPNRDALVKVAVASADEYQLYRARIEGMTPGSKEYIAVRNAHVARMNQILSAPAAAPLRGGPPVRLSRTWLVQPGTGLKVNNNYVSHVVAQMQKGVDPATLAAAYQTRSGKLTPGEAKRVRTATAWASILSTAVVYREQMKRQNSGDWKGLSPSSKAGKLYVNKLVRLASAWSRLDDAFRKQFEDMGGDGQVEGWVNALY